MWYFVPIFVEWLEREKRDICDTDFSFFDDGSDAYLGRWFILSILFMVIGCYLKFGQTGVLRITTDIPFIGVISIALAGLVLFLWDVIR